MPVFPKYDLEKQSIELPGTKTPGATGHYRHAAFADELVSHIRSAPHVETLYELFQHGLAQFPDKEFIGHRPYNPTTRTYDSFTWETFQQIDQRINAFGSGIMHLNESFLGNSQLNRWALGIWSLGRPEWYITEMSCYFYNLVNVALYDTLGPDSIEYVSNHAEIRVVVCSANHIVALLKIAHKLSSLQAIISMDSLYDTSRSAPNAVVDLNVIRSLSNENGIKVYDFEEIEALGKEFPRPHTPPKKDEVATLCYTSGTTGQPKGAMLTHKNFIAAVGTCYEGTHIAPDDVVLSYLPLAHIMGRVGILVSTSVGCKTGFFHGDMLALMDDVNELKPTFFTTVPRLLNRIYARVVAATVDAPGAVGKLSRHAVAVKLANLHAGKGVHHPLWDRLLFNKVKMALGGRVQVLGTGSAPVAKEVLDFLRVVFSCVVAEGYGSTETTSIATVTLPDEHVSGHVGCPRPGIELKLVDVPELNYLTTDQPFPRGEIQLRGAPIFKGYFKDEASTREAVDPEGWLATGDIGVMDDRGCLTIVDRKKNIFKLAQGEYVAPEKIENILTARCNLVMQIYVHGDSLESMLVAVAIPDPETFLPFANAVVTSEGNDAQEVKPGDMEGYARLLSDPRVKAAFIQELEKAGRVGGLNGYELAKKVHLTTDMFSVENGMVTPTLKIRRPQVREYFKEHIQAMYEELRQMVSAKL
ncbi:hypothetical protein BCR41DRAFT_358800 [Lobosporangium transversale]|uniref:AMP-dependent synthetase/ligase domain-containing protein n=1 Tax=Lobosporangium transversale TaxID=64571 RepID=A0A1Y2GGN5_9FUNG|nr:hypothetical protein BCR41DRAFT_358800 [Lobosporangium transversale]ORZ09050.1 hypothetical protein BCR41DRAFT_358800 [Lobosporangium transversale]|eukprot:XP_021878677.1 hypothetical protein BCR41DRAFT_358800 [Lobosporangium transversale]